MCVYCQDGVYTRSPDKTNMRGEGESLFEWCVYHCIMYILPLKPYHIFCARLRTLDIEDHEFQKL